MVYKGALLPSARNQGRRAPRPARAGTPLDGQNGLGKKRILPENPLCQTGLPALSPAV